MIRKCVYMTIEFALHVPIRLYLNSVYGNEVTSHTHTINSKSGQRRFNDDRCLRNTRVNQTMRTIPTIAIQTYISDKQQTFHIPPPYAHKS